MKLTQKRLFKGSREFEIIDDSIHVRIKTFGKEEKLTVALAVLNPDPVSNPPQLEFHSRAQRKPLFSLLLDKPDPDSFRLFVDRLIERVRAEYSEYTGIRSGSSADAMSGNSFEEPPEFGEPDRPAGPGAKPILTDSLDSSIEMLNQYLEGDDLKPLLAALAALRAEPESAARFDDLVNAFEALGPRQGAVLTYAPYIGLLLSDDPFAF